MPPLHGNGTEAPCGQKLPFAQGRHTKPPVMFWNWPPGHGEHERVPLAALAVPWGQGRQASELLAPLMGW